MLCKAVSVEQNHVKDWQRSHALQSMMDGDMFYKNSDNEEKLYEALSMEEWFVKHDEWRQTL